MNKDQLLKALYNKQKVLQDRLKFEVMLDNVWYTVELLNLIDGNPDCKIGNFAKNHWFRTDTGCSKNKYNSFDKVIKDIQKTAENKGFTLQKYKVYTKDNILLYDNV